MTVQEVWQAEIVSLGLLEVVQAEVEEAARNLALVAHVDACPATQLEGVDIEMNMGIITGCGDGWYCDKAKEIQGLGGSDE